MNILGIIPVLTSVATDCNGEYMELIIIANKILLSFAIVAAILMVVSMIVSVTTKKWQLKNYGFWSTIKDSALFEWSAYWIYAILFIYAVAGIYFLL